jgi:hypothetical protein
MELQSSPKYHHFDPTRSHMRQHQDAHHAELGLIFKHQIQDTDSDIAGAFCCDE